MEFPYFPCHDCISLGVCVGTLKHCNSRDVQKYFNLLYISTQSMLMFYALRNLKAKYTLELTSNYIHCLLWDDTVACINLQSKLRTFNVPDMIKRDYIKSIINEEIYYHKDLLSYEYYMNKSIKVSGVNDNV